MDVEDFLTGFRRRKAVKAGVGNRRANPPTRVLERCFVRMRFIVYFACQSIMEAARTRCWRLLLLVSPPSHGSSNLKLFGTLDAPGRIFAPNSAAPHGHCL